MARAETAPADNCLSSPKSETPAGSHWYYRVDHATKRNCWYLRREGGSVAQTVPQRSLPAPAPPPAAKPSLADAHAELQPQANVREDAAAAKLPANTGSANAPVWNNATAAVATRWPELPPASSAPKAVPTTTTDATNSVTQPAAADTTASAAASVADLPTSIQPEMIPTMIAATLGALAFAGAGALIARRFRRRVRRRKATSARGAIWDTTDDDRIVLSDPAADERDDRPRFARGVASTASRPRGQEFKQRAPEFVQRAPRRARG
jgi:hypothetical protein